MKESNLRFSVQALRTMASPYKKTEGDDGNLETIHYLIVNMKHLPADIPLEVNPRKPKKSTAIWSSLAKAVTDPDPDFYLNNRGIIISAKSLSFDPSNSIVTINLGDSENEEDLQQYGILDGGHTYTAILDTRKDIPEGINRYVRVEVITNVQDISRLSEARNTSREVTDTALLDLRDELEPLKNAIQGEPYAQRVAYKDNDVGEEDAKKDIHASDLLRLMFAFDIDRFPDDRMAPVQSFSGKAQVVNRYKDAHKKDFYQALIGEVPKLVELYDVIERELPQKYKDYKKNLGEGAKFGLVRGIVSADKASTYFLKNPMSYKISSGYIYPLLGAFRCLLRYNPSAKATFWQDDPVELWNEVGVNLVQKMFETSTNPQFAGKDKELWLSNYTIVENQSLRKLVQQRKL